MIPKQIAKVADFLNVSPNQVKRCEEWASVLFVQVHGCRPRFVSKKVIMQNSATAAEAANMIAEAISKARGEKIETDLIGTIKTIELYPLGCITIDARNGRVNYSSCSDPEAKKIAVSVMNALDVAPDTMPESRQKNKEWFYGAADEESF